MNTFNPIVQWPHSKWKFIYIFKKFVLPVEIQNTVQAGLKLNIIWSQPLQCHDLRCTPQLVGVQMSQKLPNSLPVQLYHFTSSEAVWGETGYLHAHQHFVTSFDFEHSNSHRILSVPNRRVHSVPYAGVHCPQVLSSQLSLCFFPFPAALFAFCHWVLERFLLS